MPIVSGASAPVSPPPTSTPARPSLTLTWVDPTGREWPLIRATGSRWWTTPDLKGVQSAVPVNITSDDRPRGGTVVRHIQDVARLITLPLMLHTPDYEAFYQDRRDLVDAFTRTSYDGPGTLVVARPDGTARQISAYYQDGWSEGGVEALRYDVAALTLYCPDPWWQDTVSTEVLRTGAAGSTEDYLNPLFSVTSSQTLGSTVVTNDGQGRAWPVWTITGPCSGVTATNNTNGLAWSFDPAPVLAGPLGSGDVVTIGGDPPTITGPGSSSWVPAVDWSHSDIWPLERGDNDIDFSVSGPGTGTAISMTYTKRWETA